MRWRTRCDFLVDEVEGSLTMFCAAESVISLAHRTIVGTTLATVGSVDALDDHDYRPNVVFRVGMPLYSSRVLKMRRRFRHATGSACERTCLSVTVKVLKASLS